MRKSNRIARLALYLTKSCCLVGLLLMAACTTPDKPLRDLEPVSTEMILEAPAITESDTTEYPEEQVTRGKYLVDLLGCGMCHTDGALFGKPDKSRNLAGSHIGIAYTNPMVDENPGVIYPTNLTPDTTTGIGGRSASDIARLIKSGQDGHSRRLNTVMPWPSYAKIDKDDAMAIAVYLLSLPPVSHRVPDPVAQGQVATAPYVHFGIYHGL